LNARGAAKAALFCFGETIARVLRLAAMKQDALPVRKFADQKSFHDWLKKHHATSDGLWLRIARRDSGVQTVSWEGAVDEGLRYGWSESQRRKGDDKTYLQLFTPRRKAGTVSPRAKGRVKALLRAGRITKAGREALGID
jgi:uncharacterized protein YdeI (YjbR/CyaY-like superfamily)